MSDATGKSLRFITVTIPTPTRDAVLCHTTGCNGEVSIDRSGLLNGQVGWIDWLDRVQAQRYCQSCLVR